MSLTEVANEAGVQIMVVTSGGPEPAFFSSLRAEAPSDTEWRAYLPLLKAELGLYTACMLRDSGLRSVVLCDEITYRGRRSSGVSDLEDGKIYLSVLAHEVRKDKARRTVHHELFHLIDYRHGTGYGPDPGWNKLNEGSFRYGEGDWHDSDPGEGSPDKSAPGFLNRYSRSAPREDRAEVYAHLMAGRDLVERRVRSDGVLKCKCEELKQRMAKYFPEDGLALWEKGHESRHD